MFAKILTACVFALLAITSTAMAGPPECMSAMGPHSAMAASLPIVIDLDSRVPPPPVLYLYRGQTVTFVHRAGTRVTISPPWGLVIGGRVGNSYVYRAVNGGSGMFLINVSGGPGGPGGTRFISIRIR